MSVILTMQSKFENTVVAVTNGTGGAALGNESNEIVIPIIPNIKQIDSSGADDALFDSITSGIEEMETTENIACVSGASCCEVLVWIIIARIDIALIQNRMILLDRKNINTKNSQFKIEKLIAIEKYSIARVNINTGANNDNDNNNNNMLKQFKITKLIEKHSVNINSNDNNTKSKRATSNDLQIILMTDNDKNEYEKLFKV